MRYPGGKGKSYQRIINMMPPHRVYIESHLGGGAVMRHKKPAEINIGIDIDPEPLRAFEEFPTNYKFICCDAVAAINSLALTPDTLIYADPPYLPQTRRASRVYRHEYTSTEHASILKWLRDLPCMVMISGYPSELYDEMLADWVREEFLGTSHVGLREEVVWMNFEARLLHDVRFLGDTYRDRDAGVRKRYRWKKRFQGLRKPYQQAVLTDLVSVFMSDLDKGERVRMANLLLKGESV